jgi:hypothetical protein
MVFNHLLTNGIKVLGGSNWHTPSKVKQSLRDRLQNNLITSPNESDPVTFSYTQPVSD